MPRVYKPRLTLEDHRLMQQHGAGLLQYHGAQAAGYYSSYLGIGKSLVTSCLPQFMPGYQAIANQALSTTKVASIPILPKTKRKYVPKRIRELVWDTYIGRAIGAAPCVCCSQAQISQLNFDCGHVVSAAKGGKSVVPNLRPICAACNKSMGTKDMRVFIAECGFTSI